MRSAVGASSAPHEGGACARGTSRSPLRYSYKKHDPGYCVNPMAKAPDPVELVSRRIRTLRAERLMTLDELARRTGLSQGHISKLERGLQTPTVGTLDVLASALGVEALDLLSDPERSLRHAAVARTAELDNDALRAFLTAPGGASAAPALRVIAGGGESQKPSRKRRTSRRRRTRRAATGLPGAKKSGDG